MFVIHCLDKADSAELRHEKRPLHLAYLKKSADVVKGAGPLSNPAGKTIGGMFVLDIDDRAEAIAWTQRDPFTEGGLYERVEVHAWSCLLGSGIASTDTSH